MTKYASKTTGLHTWSRSWEVQRAPYRHPLPYRFDSYRETQYPFRYPGGDQVGDRLYGATNLSGNDFNTIAICTNAARQKAIERAKGGASAALGLTIMDWRSSLTMISNALRSLASKRARAKFYYKRKASEIYLEGIFGWVPLMQDIYQAHEVLTRSIPVSFQKGRGQATSTGLVNDSTFRGSVQLHAGCLAGLGVRLDNPNLALLENLGLANPLSVAWDRVPYSFVINWFIPVGQMLNSLTDLLGYTVLDPYYTVYWRKVASGSILVRDTGTPNWDYVWRHRHCERVGIVRTLGVPPFTLPKPALPRADLTKALISMALFDQAREPTRPPRKG